MSQIDVLFVIPSSSQKAYQALKSYYAAIEPPTWALLLANSIRKVNFKGREKRINVKGLI